MDHAISTFNVKVYFWNYILFYMILILLILFFHLLGYEYNKCIYLDLWELFILLWLRYWVFELRVLRMLINLLLSWCPGPMYWISAFHFNRYVCLCNLSFTGFSGRFKYFNIYNYHYIILETWKMNCYFFNCFAKFVAILLSGRKSLYWLTVASLSILAGRHGVKIGVGWLPCICRETEQHWYLLSSLFLQSGTLCLCMFF